MLRDIELAQDAFQEAALRALLGIGRLRGPERFRAWLCGIALDVCRDWLHSPNPWTTQTLQGGIGGPELADPGLGPGAGRSSRYRPAVRDAVAALPDGRRQAVEAYYLSGLTGREVATLLHRSVGAVKTRLFKGRQNLRAGMLTGSSHQEVDIMTNNHADLVAMTVSEVRQAPPDESGRSNFIVLLVETDGDRRLPTWIGDFEAAARPAIGPGG